MTAGSSLHDLLEAQQFVVTAELGVPHGADPDAVERKAAALRGVVDAVNLTDNPSASVRMSSVAASVLAMRAGVEPVLQLTCRDRNRIALQSDLIGAAALGIRNVLLLTGDHPRFGSHPDAKAVFDLDSVQLTWLAALMRDEGRLLSGRRVSPAPAWTIGVVENPFAPPTDFRARRLAKKAAAGAQFVQTQFVFDVPAFDRWMAQVRDLGVDRRCRVIAGVGPIRSLRALEFMQRQVPGVHIPDDVARRLRGVPADRVAAEGEAICAETLAAVADIDGVAGVHLMALGFESGIQSLLDASGITRLRGRQPEAASNGGHQRPRHGKERHAS